MKIFALIVGIFLISATTSAAAEEYAPSLASVFFTTDELSRMTNPEAKSPSAAVIHPDIHLNAVLYYGPDNWSIWINGAKWTPWMGSTDFQIISVSGRGQVRLALHEEQQTPPDGRGQKVLPPEIVLCPHQTWNAATGTVIEGGP